MIRDLTQNQILTLKLLDELGEFTQTEASKKLNISVPAMNVQFKKFKQDGYIIETDQLQLGDVGRPKRYWSINWQGNFVLSFTFISCDLLMGLSDFSGNIINWKTESLLNCNDHSSILKLIDDFAEESKEYVRNKSGHIRSAYFGITGNIQGIVEKSVNIQVLEGLNIPELISSFEDTHSIFSQSCSHLYAFYFGESYYYNEQTTINVIEWDDGIGNVTGLGNKIFYIPHNTHTSEERGIRDIGHMVIKKDGYPCRCGKYGCLEAYAASWAIRKQCNSDTTLEELISLIQNGGQEPLKLLNDAAELLGEHISWLVRYWGVDKIAFTGRMSILLPYFKDSFCKGLLKSLSEEKVKSLSPSVNSDNPFERILRGASQVAKLIFFCDREISYSTDYSDVIYSK